MPRAKLISLSPLPSPLQGPVETNVTFGLRVAAMSVAIALLAPAIASAQQSAPPDTTGGTVVSGDVYDSVQAMPVGGAIVQLVSLPHPALSFSARSDSLGRFSIAHVPPGSYLIGFVDPMLSELGLSMIEERVDIGATPIDHVRLAIPGQRAMHDKICGPSKASDSSGVMVGFVHDASTGMPVGLSTVVVIWRELTIDNAGLHNDRRQVPAKTTPAGWFALCGLPFGTPLETRAELGARATGFIEVEVPLHGVLERDFDMGTDTATASAIHTAVSPLGDAMRHGTARLVGTVRDSSGRFLQGAHVTLWGSGTTVTDASGRFDLDSLPSGTGTIEARYLGFEPKQKLVDLAPGRTDTVRVVMNKPVTVLAGVRVYADRATTAKLKEFEDRRKHGVGHYYTDLDIVKARPMLLTDFFYLVPGIRVQSQSGLDYQLLSTHGASIHGPCAPDLWIDGVHVDTTFSVNEMVQPNDVAGIEVYDAASAPPQYLRGACGAILIWTK